MSSSYRLELDRWLKDLDVKADRVLDIGGSQLPVKGRTKSWNVKEYLIADLPEPHVRSPEPDIVMDLNEPFIFSEDAYMGDERVRFIRQGKTFFTAGGFDLIFCLEVYDYVWNPANATYLISALLKSGGTAWITFPAFYPHHQPVEDDALRYMQAGIIKLAESSGLSVEQMIKRRPETNLLDQFFRAERMRAAKQFDHEITGWICEFKK